MEGCGRMNSQRSGRSKNEKEANGRSGWKEVWNKRFGKKINQKFKKGF